MNHLPNHRKYIDGIKFPTGWSILVLTTLFVTFCNTSPSNLQGVYSFQRPGDRPNSGASKVAALAAGLGAKYKGGPWGSCCMYVCKFLPLYAIYIVSIYIYIYIYIYLYYIYICACAQAVCSWQFHVCIYCIIERGRDSSPCFGWSSGSRETPRLAWSRWMVDSEGPGKGHYQRKPHGASVKNHMASLTVTQGQGQSANFGRVWYSQEYQASHFWCHFW
jgi:hypothetical protein